jgi:putative transposase
VLMPNHVHLLIGEPAQVTPSTALQVLKQRMSRAMLPQRPVVQIALADRSGGSKPMPFWQRRFYDFNVYTRGKIKEKLNYMHANPVTRKLVSHPKDWPWSSWSFMNVEKMG